MNTFTRYQKSGRAARLLERYQNGRPATRTDPFRQVGSSGLDNWGGYIDEDFLTDWNTLQKRVDNVTEMLYNSPILGGALRLSIEMPLQKIDWYWSSEEGEDDPRLEILNDSWEAMTHSWEEHITESLLFVFYGFSYFTTMYQRIDGRVLWRKFMMLGHDSIQRWYMDESGSLEGVQQYAQYWPDPIPIERSLLYRFRRTKNNPEGESILRPAWVPYYYTKNLMDIEAIGIERNLAGIPVVQMGEGSDPDESGEDYKKADKIARNLRNDEQAGIVLPPPQVSGGVSWDVNLLSSAGLSKTIDTNLIIARYEKRMLAAALSQFIMLGMDNVGALATFEGATDFQAMLVDAVADNIAAVQTKYAAPRLLALNGLDSDGISLEHSPAGKIDLAVFTQALASVQNMLTWTPEDEITTRSLMGLPEKTVEELQELQAEKQERALQMREMMRQQVGRSEQDEDNQDQEDDMSDDQFEVDISRRKKGKPINTFDQFSHITEKDIERAIRRYEEWAAENDPEMARLLRAKVVNDSRQ